MANTKGESMNFRDHTDYDPGGLIFNYNKNNELKPRNPGQLFYRDFFKLEVNTELFICSVKKGFTKTPIQFIAVEFTSSDGSGNSEQNHNTWCIRFRQKDGTEEVVDLHYVGATKYKDIWKTGVWVTHNLGEQLERIRNKDYS